MKVINRNNIKRQGLLVLIFLWGINVVLPVKAALISFEVSNSDIEVGQFVDLELWARDLGSDIISAFDMDIVVSSALLELQSVSYGQMLGDNVDSFQDTQVSGNMINLAELSILFDADLINLQFGADFMLATLRFLAVGVHSSVISLNTSSEFIGDNFTALNVDINNPPHINVLPKTASEVPEPSILTLFVIALLSSGVVKKMRKPANLGAA